MTASYPNSLKTFTTKAAGGTILAEHVNSLQDEIVAVETTLGVKAGTWQSYTPVWTAVTTNPVLGNGTLVGAYARINKIVHCKMRLTCGSTTTYGSGDYSFTLPFTSAGIAVATLGLVSVILGTARYVRLIALSSGRSYIDAFVGIADGSTNVRFNPTTPITWASGAYMDVFLTYEAV